MIRVLHYPWRGYAWLMLKRPVRFTRFGVLYILFAIAIGAAAINTGNNLLYLILGIQLGLIVVSGVLSDSSLWAIRSAWHPAEQLYAGRPAGIHCDIEKRYFPGILTRVEPRWNDQAAAPLTVAWVPVRHSVQVRFTVAPAKRGMWGLSSVRYASLFPFGFFEKFHIEKRQESWVVFPKQIPVSLLRLRELTDAGTHESSQRSGAGVVPLLVRDYRAGDPTRRIHWKHSVRTGKLWVKEMEGESDPSSVLRVDAWPDASEDLMENFISFLASVCQSSTASGHPMGLATAERYFPPSSEPQALKQLLTYLALVDPRVQSSRLRPRTTGIDAVALWQAYRGYES